MQGRNSFTSTGSVGKLFSSSALFMAWKNSMNLLQVMSRVDLALFTGASMFERRRKYKEKIAEEESEIVRHVEQNNISNCGDPMI